MPFIIMSIATVAILATVAGVFIARNRRNLAAQQLDSFDRAMAALLTHEYIPRSILEEWTTNVNDAIALAKDPELSRFLPGDRSARYRTHRRNLRDVAEYIQRLNQEFLVRRLEEDKEALDKVEKFPLTGRQRLAVATDENNTFVVAGAGTGKTSTIVAKVDYLTRRGLAPPPTRFWCSPLGARLPRSSGIDSICFPLLAASRRAPFTHLD